MVVDRGLSQLSGQFRDAIVDTVKQSKSYGDHTPFDTDESFDWHEGFITGADAAQITFDQWMTESHISASSDLTTANQRIAKLEAQVKRLQSAYLLAEQELVKNAIGKRYAWHQGDVSQRQIDDWESSARISEGMAQIERGLKPGDLGGLE